MTAQCLKQHGHMHHVQSSNVSQKLVHDVTHLNHLLEEESVVKHVRCKATRGWCDREHCNENDPINTRLITGLKSACHGQSR